MLNPVESVVNPNVWTQSVSKTMSSGSWGNFYKPSYNIMNDYTPPGFAKGGIAHGLSLVGEEGPELIDAVTPSRVYTAKQTREALSGGPQNVKVEIVNKSGQDVKASNADVKFDAKGMIISVVIDAVTRNTNGMREIIKGVATT